ncbi:chitinase, partial [Streptomyces poriferorum]
TPTAQPTATATPTPTGTAGGGTASGAGFAPYVDTSLYPAYDLVDTATKTGVKQFTLAFITSGGSCAPLWGGVTGLGDDHVASQIGALRAAGGDVRVSFGGAAGSELALNCASAADLATAYGKVVDTYKLTKVDFDIEGGALPDTAANSRRSQAIAQLQKSHPGLDVSFTLPVMPEGLTQPGVDLIADAKKNGVDVGAVNVMAMDYGASYSGDMGTYAIQAATATQAQIKGVLGLSDADAWKTVAVTPMIGVN